MVEEVCPEKVVATNGSGLNVSQTTQKFKVMGAYACS